jgi:hypothetical protein
LAKVKKRQRRLAQRFSSILISNVFSVRKAQRDVNFTCPKLLVQLSFISSFKRSSGAARHDFTQRMPMGIGAECEKSGVVVMARYELNAADAADAMNMVPAPSAPEAFYELGMMYACGRSVPADLVSAHKWLNIAVARGLREAAARRAELAMEMSADQIAEAQREARLWLTRH